MIITAKIVFHENRIFTTLLAKKIVFCLAIIFVFDFFMFSAPVLAGNAEGGDNIIIENSASSNIVIDETVAKELIVNNEINNQLPINKDIAVKWSKYYTVTAYNSEEAQCDDSPCITANGFNVCEHGIEDTIAVNFLQFGTKVRIPELFGDRVFIVRDRMNSRYNNRIDIWMKEKQDAINFGIQYTKIEVLEP